MVFTILQQPRIFYKILTLKLKDIYLSSKLRIFYIQASLE